MSDAVKRSRLAPLVLSLSWMLFAGCGGGDEGQVPTVRVAGSLAIDGKPVAKGRVHFHPEKGRPASGDVKDGKFTLTTYSEGDGAIAGKNRVAVEVTEEVPAKDGDTMNKSLIPVKFANPDESGLQLDVRPSGYTNLQIQITGGSGSIKED